MENPSDNKEINLDYNLESQYFTHREEIKEEFEKQSDFLASQVQSELHMLSEKEDFAEREENENEESMDLIGTYRTNYTIETKIEKLQQK